MKGKTLTISLVLFWTLVSTVFASEYLAADLLPKTGFETIDAPIYTGPYPPHRDEADLVGERIEVGSTYYDYQSNGTLSKQIVVDEDGGIHIIWMRAPDEDIAAGARHVFYNYVVDGEAQLEEGVQVDDLVRAGYTNVGYSPDVGVIPFFHATLDAEIRLFIAQDQEFGEGAFDSFVLPNDNDRMFVWPHGTVDANGRIHVLAREYPPPNGIFTNPVDVQYNRGAFDEEEWEFEDPEIIGQTKVLGYGCAASRVSDRVALYYFAPAYDANEWNRWAGSAGADAANNNILIFESEDGEEWDFDEPINVTNVLRPDPEADNDSPFYIGDSLRPYLYLDACYDADDNLHVIFSSVGLWENPDPNSPAGETRYSEKTNLIWHWDRESGEMHYVAEAWYTAVNANPGAWRSNISFPSIGATDDGNLYIIFTKYLREGERGANGYINGEVFATVSLNGGQNWAEAINITETHADNNQPGEGESETWCSLAEIVDDNLYISYIYDLDPGGVPQNEGAITDNPVMFHVVPVEDIPTEPLVVGRDYHVGFPPEISVGDDPLEVVGVPGGDPAEVELTVTNSNDADGALGLYITLEASEGLADVVSIEPAGMRIAPGADGVVTISFNPDREGEIEGSILVSHNDPEVESPIEVPFSGLGAEGFGRIFGMVQDLANNDDPVPEAVITLFPGNFQTVSDEEGNYEFEMAPALEYMITCQAETFILFEDEIDLDDEEDLEFNISMRFALFELSIGDIDIAIGRNEDFGEEFSVINDGNGPVTYTTSYIFPEEHLVEPFELRDEIPIQEIVDDRYIQGVAHVNGFFYVTGGNSGEMINKVYVLDNDGNLERSFDQFAESRLGMRDLAWDGELLWGSDARIVYGFTTGGDRREEFEGPYNPNNNITFDTENEWLWVSSRTDVIVAVDREGNPQGEVEPPNEDFRISGLAYHSGDPDGFPLYVLGCTDESDLSLWKCNPATGEYRHVIDFVDFGGDGAGCEITGTYDPFSWVFVTVIQDNPDSLAVWQINMRSEWIEIEPSEGSVDGDSESVLTANFDTYGIPPGTELEITVVFEHDGRGGAAELPVLMEVTEEGGMSRRALNLGLGWNLISLNIEPDTDDVIELTAPLVENESLFILKDGRGRFYIPSIPFNNIPRWDPAQGYYMRMNEPDRWTVTGVGIEPDRPIPLTNGWQMVSYYPRDPVDARIAVAGIEDVLFIIKDARGRFYLPGIGFSNMGDLREGQGYQLRVTEDVDLVYQMGDVVATTVGVPYPEHFTSPDPTDANMSVLLINAPEDLVEAAAVSSDGVIVGAGAADRNGMIGIAVWGVGSSDGNGLTEGDSFELTGWDGESEMPLNIDWNGTGGRFETNGVVIGRIMEDSGLPREFALHPAYPNPFNSSATVRFDLPDKAWVTLRLFDVSGREVKIIAQGLYGAGRFSAVIDAKTLASGIYFYRLEAGSFTGKRKIVLLR